MIVKKTFEVNTKDIDSVVVELANEIKAGWTIDSIGRGDMTINRYDFNYWPTFEVVLVRRK